MTEAYPLQWPFGKPRTSPVRIEYSRFKADNLAVEFANVRAELRRLRADNIVVSSNVPQRADGKPYTSGPNPADAGVAVYFTFRSEQKCFACDRWKSVPENLRAVSKSIEAIRGLERWGSKTFVDAAFAGFTALPAPETKLRWWEVLGVHEDATPDQISAAYRNRAKELHRVGAGHDEIVGLNLARDAAINARALT